MFKRVLSFSFVVLAASLMLLQPAFAAPTPFGGDDTGFIPSGGGKGPAGKCEDAIGTAVGKAVSCIGKCTISRADGKLADDTAEDNCEKNLGGKSCLEKFQAAGAKAQAKAAGACSCVNVPTISGIIESTLDSMNSNVYCDTTSGTPFGGDDTGDVPVAKSATAKCEDGVSKLVAKATGCIIGCHKKRADGKLADDTAEDACEKNNGGKS